MTTDLIKTPATVAAAPETTLIIRTPAGTGMTWRTLVSFAAIGDLAVLGWLGLVAQDKLALSLVAGLLAGLGLARVRRGLLGRIILGLAFADMSWYTVSGAIWNIVQREGLA